MACFFLSTHNEYGRALWTIFEWADVRTNDHDTDMPVMPWLSLNNTGEPVRGLAGLEDPRS
ncbi:hypothetical protein KOEU_36000 [Komagataeibacter europaeus]|uniref:Uncharacterized protein n=1 Tax=Komagataeibacter europaeus TaxID=33995 RepID=A0A0M0ED67_KOMEU|nr:hypothetical protein KOEU_36000 [Komagataeibacter europaeus]